MSEWQQPGHAGLLKPHPPAEEEESISTRASARRKSVEFLRSAAAAHSPFRLPKIFTIIDEDLDGLISRIEWDVAFWKLAGFATAFGEGAGDLITRSDWAKAGLGKETHVYSAITSARDEGLGHKAWKKAFDLLADHTGMISLNRWESVGATDWKSPRSRMPRTEMDEFDDSDHEPDPRVSAFATHGPARRLDASSKRSLRRLSADGMRDLRFGRGFSPRQRNGSIEEVLGPMGQFNGSAGKARLAMVQLAQKLFEGIDLNKNQTIARDEWLNCFIKLVGDKRVVSRKRWSVLGGSNRMFDAMSGNRQMAVLSRRDWLTYFDTMDKDANGEISWSEFVQAFKGTDVPDDEDSSRPRRRSA